MPRPATVDIIPSSGTRYRYLIRCDADEITISLMYHLFVVHESPSPERPAVAPIKSYPKLRTWIVGERVELDVWYGNDEWGLFRLNVALAS